MPRGHHGKNIKNLLLRNHKPQSFHILFVAMYSVPLYKSCQPCPWGPYRPRPGGVMGKTLKNLLLQNHKAQSFHILLLAAYSGPLKILPTVPLGSIRAPGGGGGVIFYENHKKSSSPKPYGPELSYVVWTNV